MPFIIPVASEQKYTITADVKRSELVKAEEHKTETVQIERLKLTDLPAVMRNMGWTTAPALMERWFTSPPFIWSKESSQKYFGDPLSIPEEHYDDNLVKMDWLLEFPGMRTDMNALALDYLTANSKNMLLKRLSRANVTKHGDLLCPTNPESARELDAVCQIQIRPMGGMLDTINDIYGALGRYTLFLAVIGALNVSKAGKVSFQIHKTGVYIKDVYEFTEDQFLGYWTKEKCLGKAEILLYHAALGEARTYNALEYLNSLVFTVSNKDFRMWREKRQMGGDFVIYSDVKWFYPENQHIEFTPSEVTRYLSADSRKYS